LNVLNAPPPDAPPSEDAFTAYTESLDVNWSDDLEALHAEDAARDHFMDVWTRRALRDAIAGTTPEVILDAGCSSGFLLDDLRSDFPQARLLGVDLVAEGLRRAKKLVPEAELLLADVCNLPIQDESVDAVLSANLLEHVPDDVGAIAEFCRVLKPGGILAIVIPAGPGTYDYYDTFLGHERRYARREVARKSPGFEVIHDTHLGSIIYPPFWLIKKRNRRRHPNPSPEKQQKLVEADINRTSNSKLGELTTRAERALVQRGISTPFGIRGFTILRKP
jgi:SAM-dependent methyltransferase